MADTQLLTVDDMCNLLKCKKRTIYSRMTAGVLPQGLICGRTRRWLKADVDQWLADGCTRRVVVVEVPGE